MENSPLVAQDLPGASKRGLGEEGTEVHILSQQALCVPWGGEGRSVLSRFMGRRTQEVLQAGLQGQASQGAVFSST